MEALSKQSQSFHHFTLVYIAHLSMVPSFQIALSIDDTTFKTVEDAVDVYNFKLKLHSDHFNWVYEHLSNLLAEKLQPVLQKEMTTELRVVLDKCLGDLESCMPHETRIADVRVQPITKAAIM